LRQSRPYKDAKLVGERLSGHRTEAAIITAMDSTQLCRISTQRLAAWRKFGCYLPAIQPL